ncbi:MAG: NAD(+)/NADH kinase [Gammaproteobacteria bacterium]|nr:NAD(+)/NADH kinase [Gammaproteobacteria bacterium]
MRALEAVASFAERIGRDANGRVRWLTCSGAMGAEVLDAAGIYCYDVVYEAPPATGAADTGAAAGRFLEAGADLILFCGGDGTARDICQVTDLECPLLGIPSGVKMYSGVFGVTPARTGRSSPRTCAGNWRPPRSRFSTGRGTLPARRVGRSPVPVGTDAVRAVPDPGRQGAGAGRRRRRCRARYRRLPARGDHGGARRHGGARTRGHRQGDRRCARHRQDPARDRRRGRRRAGRRRPR